MQLGRAAFEMLEPDNPQLLLTARIYAEVLQELDDYGSSADVHRAANALLLTDPNSGYPMSVIQHFVAQEFLARAVAELEQRSGEQAGQRHYQRQHDCRPHAQPTRPPTPSP